MPCLIDLARYAARILRLAGLHRWSRRMVDAALWLGPVDLTDRR